MWPPDRQGTSRGIGEGLRVTGDGLDRDEWDRYVPGLEYVDVCKVSL